MGETKREYPHGDVLQTYDHTVLFIFIPDIESIQLGIHSPFTVVMKAGLGFKRDYSFEELKGVVVQFLPALFEA